MYLKHFGLKAQPFQLTPDIGFLFMSEAHTRAKAYMDYTVWNREGFVVITGKSAAARPHLPEGPVGTRRERGRCEDIPDAA